eukprot:Platyproteum_vivax@DN6997_c0_g1_i1.p2
MVIKTDFCAFTEMKIYPGTGSKFVGKDGKLHSFLSHKVICLFHMKVKPMKKRWTQVCCLCATCEIVMICGLGLATHEQKRQGRRNSPQKDKKDSESAKSYCRIVS